MRRGVRTWKYRMCVTSQESPVYFNRHYTNRWRCSGTLLFIMLLLLCVIRRRRTRSRRASSRGLTALSRWETSVRWSILRGSSRRPWGCIRVFLVLEEPSVKILKWVILIACRASFVSIQKRRHNKFKWWHLTKFIKTVGHKL